MLELQLDSLMFDRLGRACAYDFLYVLPEIEYRTSGKCRDCDVVCGYGRIELREPVIGCCVINPHWVGTGINRQCSRGSGESCWHCLDE